MVRHPIAAGIKHWSVQWQKTPLSTTCIAGDDKNGNYYYFYPFTPGNGIHPCTSTTSFTPDYCVVSDGCPCLVPLIKHSISNEPRYVVGTQKNPFKIGFYLMKTTDTHTGVGVVEGVQWKGWVDDSRRGERTEHSRAGWTDKKLQDWIYPVVVGGLCGQQGRRVEAVGRLARRHRVECRPIKTDWPHKKSRTGEHFPYYDCRSVQMKRCECGWLCHESLAFLYDLLNV